MPQPATPTLVYLELGTMLIPCNGGGSLGLLARVKGELIATGQGIILVEHNYLLMIQGWLC
jgi:hypothetical protein